TLSETFYDVAYWRNHHDLIAGLGIGTGDTVIVTGTVGGKVVYEGNASAKNNGHGIQHFQKRDQGQGGYSAPQQGPAPQAQQRPQEPSQWGAGTRSGDGWPPAVQPGSGYQRAPQQQGFDQPPFRTTKTYS